MKTCPHCHTANAFRYHKGTIIHERVRTGQDPPEPVWTVVLRELDDRYWECQFCHFRRDL